MLGGERQYRLALGHGARHQRHGHRVGLQVAGVHHILAQPGGKRLAQLILRYQPQFRQDLTDGPLAPAVALALLHAQALHQIGGLEHARVDQRFAQMPCPAHHGVRRSHQVPQLVGVAGLEILAGGGVLRGGVCHGVGPSVDTALQVTTCNQEGVAGDLPSLRYRAKS